MMDSPDDVAPTRGLLARPGLVRWGAHLAFWLAYFAFRTSAAATAPPMETPFPYLLNRTLVVVCYCVLTGALMALVAGVGVRRSGWARNLALVVGALLLTVLTQACEETMPRLLGWTEEERPTPFVAYLFQFGWALPLWALTQALLGYHFEAMAQARKVARAQALAYDAQLKMLHYQINPHFLFNTLNAISTLVLEKRNDQAERMLLGLSGFLRYSLDRQPTALAALAAEIEAQRKYLEIEQTRFGDKLQVRFDIEPGLDDAHLPSLILQPILENAIKHAITPTVGGGLIEVAARRDGDLLRIRVDDDGPGMSPTGQARRGVGLANARERLQLIYGGRGGLSASNRSPHGCRVEIWMPLEEEFVGRFAASAAG